MARYEVTGAAVVLPTADGSERYLYSGVVLDGDAFTEKGISHGLSVGLIREVAESEDVEREAAPVEIPEGDPTEKWTVPQLEAFADKKGIDLTGPNTKPEKLALILAVIAKK